MITQALSAAGFGYFWGAIVVWLMGYKIGKYVGAALIFLGCFLPFVVLPEIVIPYWFGAGIVGVITYKWARANT